MKIKELHRFKITTGLVGMLISARQDKTERIILQVYNEYRMSREWYWVDFVKALSSTSKQRAKGEASPLIPLTPHEILWVENAAKRIIKKKVKNKIRRVLKRRRDGQSGIQTPSGGVPPQG